MEMEPSKLVVRNDLIMDLIMKDLVECSEMRGTDVVRHFIDIRRISKEFAQSLRRVLAKRFKNVVISRYTPLDERKWQHPAFFHRRSHKPDVVINSCRMDWDQLEKFLKFLNTAFGVEIQTIKFFPINRDTFASPPRTLFNFHQFCIERPTYNGAKILCNPKNRVQDLLYDLNEEEVTISSWFLEETANNWTYVDPEYMNRVKKLLKPIKPKVVNAILTDCVLIRDMDLLSHDIIVPNMQPLEIFEVVLQELKPKVLNVKLRTEFASSLDEGIRMDWDDQNFFRTFILYNSEDFSIPVNPSMKGVEDIVLIVDTTGTHSWNTTTNESGFNFVFRDLLSLFPMKKVLIGRAIYIPESTGLVEAFQNEIDGCMESISRASEVINNRPIFVKMFFCRNIELITIPSNRHVKQSVPRYSSHQIEFDNEAAKNFFNEYSSPYLEDRYTNVRAIPSTIIRKWTVSYNGPHVIHFELVLALDMVHASYDD
ncbi:unnamed protein product [Caenorhabditis bovis]|uniref:Uncharacterized protein n=1 Tax=Caenorhabditis bovis TaxID=2654633 RepID=A0A8S1F1W3_9PELO|nr:unnamed protein product [Caenorhabditis bovis]